MLDRLKDSTGRDVVVHEASMATHITHSARRAVPVTTKPPTPPARRWALLAGRLG